MASGTITKVVSERTGAVTWRARLSFESEAGRQHRAKTFKTKREAQAWLTARLNELRTGDYVDLVPITLAEAAEIWFRRKRSSIRSSSWISYNRAWRVWIEPALGSRQVSSIKPGEVQSLYDTIEAKGRTHATVANVHKVLSAIFRMCVADGFLKSDPTRNRTLPRKPEARVRYWSADDARAFLEKSDDDDEVPALWRLLLSTGMRIGEALVLSWADFDDDQRRLRINKTRRFDYNGKMIVGEGAKSAASNRTIMLPAATVMALRRQREVNVALRQRADHQWIERDLMFPHPASGDVRLVSSVRRQFDKIVTLAGVPALTLHQLRHTAATLMLAQGVNPKVVQEQLGHATISMTLDLYGHVTSGMRDAAAEAMDAILEQPVGLVKRLNPGT